MINTVDSFINYEKLADSILIQDSTTIPPLATSKVVFLSPWRQTAVRGELMSTVVADLRMPAAGPTVYMVDILHQRLAALQQDFRLLTHFFFHGRAAFQVLWLIQYGTNDTFCQCLGSETMCFGSTIAKKDTEGSILYIGLYIGLKGPLPPPYAIC